MNKIEKKFSLILAVVLLFNFVMPSLVFAEDVFELDTSSSQKQSHIVYQNKPLIFTTDKSGLYTFTMSNKYLIQKNDTNLCVATYVDDGGNINSEGLSNAKTNTVTVYLQAGQNYTIFVPSNIEENQNISGYTVNYTYHSEILEENIREITDTNAANYTASGSNWASFGMEPQIEEPTKQVTQADLNPKAKTELESHLETENNNDEKASTLQKVAVWLLVYGIGDTFKNLISFFVGEVSIDKILFDKYPDTRLSFYPENQGTNANPYLSKDSKVLDVINDYFNVFRGLAFAFYIIMLLYVGIRVLLSSTGKEKEKYKSLMSNWLMGILILVFFPLIIKYTILLNEGLVGLVDEKVNQPLLKENGGTIFPDIPGVDDAMVSVLSKGNDNPKDIMGLYRKEALEKEHLGFAFIYLFLIKELVAFLIVYYKRLITIVFLIVLFPFVAISYVFDKVKDGQAQIFSAWCREFMLNVFTQLFQAILYCTVLYIILALRTSGTANVVLVLVGLGFIRKGDSLLHAIFPTLLKGGGAGTTKDIGETAKSMVKVGAVKSMISSAQNMGKRITHAKNKVSDLREQAYEHREKQNFDNDAKRQVRLEQGRTRDAKDKNKLRLNLNKAVNGINVLPKEEIDQMTPEQREKKDIELKREGLNNLNYAKYSKDPEVQKAYQEFMDGLKPREKARLEKRMKASEAINMLITKKGRDGVELTEKTLNIQAKILFDVTQGGPDNALYGDLYKWMDSKEISTGEKEVQHRSKKTGKLASGKDYEDRKNSGEKFVDTIVDKKQKLTEYFGMAIDEKGQQVAGLGIRGRVLTDKGNRQKEKLNQELANPVLKNADGTKVATGYTMTKKERETALGMVDATDDEATKKVKEENKRKIEAIAEKFGAGKTGEEKDEIKEMAGLTVLLGEYKKQEKINGKSREISAKEALGISSRMLELSKNNSGAKRIMDVMVVGEDTPVKPIGDVDVFTPAGKDTDDLGNPRGPESPTEDTVDVKTEELEELKLNLGYSVEGFARKAAKGVIIQNDMLGNNEREKVTRLAVDTLRAETHDELALSETYDAELDDLINGYRDLDDDGFIDETNLTQEEIMQKRHEDRVKNVQRWYADGTLRESRSVMARATGEALGATASATYGNVAKVSAGIIGGSVITGLQREGNLQNAFLSSAGAMSAEDSVEKIVMGTYASENKYDKKDKKKEKKLPTIGTKAGDLTEKAFKVHRAASEDINNPKYESRGTAVESSSQERTMTRLLSNMEELKRGKKK